MDNMVLSIFESKPRAEEARRYLLAREREHQIGIDDLVILEKTGEGKLKFHHFSHLTLSGGIGGAFLGALFGILLLNPLFVVAGLLFGFVVGAIAGAFSHVGVDREFIEREVGGMLPGNAALFVMDRENAAGILEELKKFGGPILQTRICTQSPELRKCTIMGDPATSMA
jgi:uncharacterized membrane protein